MPHPHSPHQPDSAELAGGLGTFQPSKDEFGAPSPLHAPTPLSAPRRSSRAVLAMTTAYSEPALSKEPPTSFLMLNEPTSMQWTVSHGELPNNVAGGSSYIPQFTSDSPALYDYSQNSVRYIENYNLTYPSAVPRSYANDIDLTGLPIRNIPQSYPPDAYQIEPQTHEAMDLADQGISGQLMQLRQEDYDSYGPLIKQEGHTAYSSPYESDVTRNSTPAGPSTLDYKNECDEGAIDKEQPYAQLIHRALMEVPGHTMILRDIYDWFKKNTDKAADKETKGWQNSIRHNLSMNGAFEKVDQPCEESKRGFMWRLTQEAIHEGVKSTTRYRSKQPNKRGHRSLNPLPQRQASGAKGGQAARRAGRMRRSNHNSRMNDSYRSEPYRSVPPTGLTTAPMFDTDTTGLPSSFPSTPYYGSPVMSESNFCDSSEFGQHHGMELFQPRTYNASPFTQHMPPCGDTAYIQEPINPADPMIFANSPSPTADEPRTPESPLGGGWGDDLILGGMEHGAASMVYDTPYNEFPV